MENLLNPIPLYAGRLRSADTEPAVILPNNILLAPLAGVSDLPMRRLCRSMGAGLTCTELVSARGLRFAGLEKSWRYIRLASDERAVAIQLFGHDPEDFQIALEKILTHPQLPRPTIIDINMGCPVQKVTKTMAGSALMQNPTLAANIISGCQNILADYNIPLTCKFRRGYDKDSNIASEFAWAVLEGGANMVTVHGRTRAQGYSGEADWHCIEEVVAVSKKFAKRYNLPVVPVIANGDIVDGPSAVKALELTGAAGVMIGRAAMGNPWIFREIIHYMQTGTNMEPATVAEKIAAINIQYADYLAFHDEIVATRELRKVLGWYLYGLYGAAGLRQLAVKVNNQADVAIFLQKMVENSKKNY